MDPQGIHTADETVRKRQSIAYSLIACPACKTALTRDDGKLHCSQNHGPFYIDSRGTPLLIQGFSPAEDEKEFHEGINALKTFLKKFPRLYYTIWYIFCPVLMVQNGPQKIFRHLEKNPRAASGEPRQWRVLDVGSGPQRWHEACINLDVFPFPEVDVVGNAEALPFSDNTFDAIVSESLLEHTEHPATVVNEMLRVTKPGGVIYASVPFMTPYHASPRDFTRWTREGLVSLFPGTEEIESGVRSGPWSALLVFLAYWLGLIFTFGSRKAAPFFAFVFMLVLGPLKIFDLILTKLPGADAVSAQVYVLLRKT